MPRRWLIQGPLLIFLFLSATLWLASHFATFCGYRVDSGPMMQMWILDVSHGEVSLTRRSSINGPGHSCDWALRAARPSECGKSSRSTNAFLGFDWSREQASPSRAAGGSLSIPCWFPTVYLALALLYACRRTRPPSPTQAFPVEPPAPTSP